MTRNEALNVLTGSLYFGLPLDHAKKWLAIFEALEMIKIEEPLSPTERLVVALNWPIGGRSHSELNIALSHAAVKLVDSNP